MFSFFKIVFLSSLYTNLFAQTSTIDLNQNWQFTNANKIHWYKATVPGTIHTDLLANKIKNYIKIISLYNVLNERFE